jgi:NADH-quinone oxidoreductase subunit J
MVLGAILISIWRALPAPNKATDGAAFGIGKFSVAFLNEYWLQFELTSVLLVAAVVAALAVIRVSRRTDRTRPHG